MPDEDFDRLAEQLDIDGEEAVRLKLSGGIYGPRRRPYVEEWLRRKIEARISASNAEQMRLARSAKNAAWAAAIAAIIAAICAIIALIPR